MALVYILDGLTLEEVDVIEEYSSCIWTERFIETGEVNLQVGATHENAALLRPRTLILHEDSDEPMMIQTREVKDGVLTAVGKTLEAELFGLRYIDIFGEFGYEFFKGTPPEQIVHVFEYMQAHRSMAYHLPNVRVLNNGYYSSDEFNSGYPNAEVRESYKEREKAYDAMLRLAKKYVVGMRVRRLLNPLNEDDSLPEYKWGLAFELYRAKDKTAGDNYLGLSSEDDTLANIHEVYSVADWVDVVLAYPPDAWVPSVSDGNPASYPEWPSHGGPENFSVANLNPFEWRIEEIDTEDITLEYLNRRLTDYYGPEGEIETIPWNWADLTLAEKHYVLYKEMGWKAQSAWAKHQKNQKVIIDGEIVGDLQYGKDYKMGDVVEVEGDFTGGKRNAMITEYTRSTDGSGGKSHPTLAAPLMSEAGEIYGNEQAYNT